MCKSEKNLFFLIIIEFIFISFYTRDLYFKVKIIFLVGKLYLLSSLPDVIISSRSLKKGLAIRYMLLNYLY